MNFDRVVFQFLNGTVDMNRVSVQLGYRELIAFLNSDSNPKNIAIRMYFDNSNSFGHQSNTVAILQDFVENGLKKSIEAWYIDDNTLNKLTLLLPGFSGNSADTYDFEAGSNQVTISFKKYKIGNPPTTEYLFGFTGGADSKGNFAQLLNTTYFIKWQPYKWLDNSPNPVEEVISFKSQAKETINLDTVESLGNKRFRERSYFRNIPEYNQRVWNIFKQQAKFKDKISCLEVVRSELAKINLTAVYGIGQKNAFSKSPEQMLFNLVSGILESQTSRFTKTAKKTVVLLLATFTAKELSEFEEILKGNYDPNGDYEGKERICDINFDDEETPPSLKRLKGFCDFINSKRDYPGRVKIQASLDATTTQSNINKLQANEVLLINLGSVPPEIFNYLYAVSSLPPVFEGMGTAGFAVNLGKPYFHISKGETVYPSVLLNQFVIAGTPLLCQGYANQIPELLNGPGWNQSQDLLPPIRISYFLETLYKNDDNVILDYFKEVGAFYHNESNGKLAMTGNYFMNLIQQP